MPVEVVSWRLRAEDIGKARDELAPGEADVLLAAADLAQARGQTDRARSDLEEGARLLEGLCGLHGQTFWIDHGTRSPGNLCADCKMPNRQKQSQNQP